MRILINIPDNKAGFFMELLKNFSFVKAKIISPVKAEFLEELKEAIDALNRVKAGKEQVKSAKDLLNKL
jgi:predicted DNA-binding protein